MCANNNERGPEGGIVGGDKEVGKLKVVLSKSGKNIGYCEIITAHRLIKTF
jgi:hypothetical protein